MGINNVCAGQGTCSTCKVQLVKGIASEPTSHERIVFSSRELKAGWRLACQTYPAGDCKLSVPPESMTAQQRTQVEGREMPVMLEPRVQAYHVQLPVPSLSNPQADADSLLATINQQHQLLCNRVDIDVLRILSPLLRDGNWQCRATVKGDEVIAVGPWPGRHLGLAIDLGTTKIAGYLVDLSDGRTLAAGGIMNPQISYGEDIISRISSIITSPDVGMQLQKLVIEAINGLAASLCAEIDAGAEDIVETVVVGNTAMHHIFLGLPVRQLALSPYLPAVSKALDIKARELGLRTAPGGYVHLLPNIAGFVGADHVAVLLATGALREKRLKLVLDIGTNTEVSLIDNGKITAVSCASGPAFEGGHIKDGMRAARGAIERVRITNGNIQYQTIDDAPPVGICGSGILDALAQLYLAGIVDKSGRMKDGHPRVRTRNKQREFVLAKKGERANNPAIVITQQDIRELQLGKAAIQTGIKVLLEANGRTEKEIEQVIIAGAFGTYIDVASAVAIGMLPSLPLRRFRQIGNAAGMGARMALISRSKQAEAQIIGSRVNYIELASNPNFMQIFMQSSYLGRYHQRASF